ncbi:MAG: HAMP domain-containing sensor histidine kinase, partial [Candidatus Thermoplasmatota archaeon]
RLKLRREAASLAPLVKEAVDSFEAPARLGGLAIRLDSLPDVRVDVDQAKCMQVLMNLVSNAVKYTPTGGRVDVGLKVDAKEAIVSIQDNGLGMTPEQLAQLFQPFVRLHEDKPGVAKGTGLGLYISKGIVEQHGGRIWAESAGPGKGSTFFVAWPVAGSQATAAVTSPAA